MSVDVEALGDFVTAGIVAHAVEPSHGGGDATASKCLNCGFTLAGSHCHQCGQKGNVHRTLSAFGHELLHGVFHFEGKIFRTLPLLIFKPGELTRRYVHGERARFISPLALFLFSVFLMFAVFGMVGGPVKTDPRTATTNYAPTVAEPNAEVAEADTKLARLEVIRTKAVAAKRSTTALDEQIDQAKKARRDLVTASLSTKEGRPDWEKIGKSLEVKGSVDTGVKRIDEMILHAGQNPSLAFYKIQSSAYKYSWSLIPLSAPFLWLLFFWRRDIHVYDHLVFITYSISFMTLFAVLLALLGSVSFLSFVIGPLAVIVPSIHIYRQMKGAYSLGWKSALLRTSILMLSIIGLIIPIFALSVLALGLG